MFGISPGFLSSLVYTLLGVTWNNLDATAGWSYFDGDKRITTTSSTWQKIRAHGPRGSGKWYWEVYQTSYGNGGNIGYTCFTANSSDFFGQVSDATKVNFYISAHVNSNGAGNGVLTGPTGTMPAGFTSGNNRTFGFAIDYEAGKVWIASNNTWYNSGNPATGVNPTWTFNAIDMVNNPGCPGVSYLGNFGGGANVTLRVTTPDLIYTPPQGFLPWSGI